MNGPKPVHGVKQQLAFLTEASPQAGRKDRRWLERHDGDRNIPACGEKKDQYSNCLFSSLSEASPRAGSNCQLASAVSLSLLAEISIDRNELYTIDHRWQYFSICAIWMFSEVSPMLRFFHPSGQDLYELLHWQYDLEVTHFSIHLADHLPCKSFKLKEGGGLACVVNWQHSVWTLHLTRGSGAAGGGYRRAWLRVGRAAFPTDRRGLRRLMSLVDALRGGRALPLTCSILC